MGNEKYFDENVLDYDRYNRDFSRYIAYAGISDGGRVLEIGCGAGNATLPFLETGRK